MEIEYPMPDSIAVLQARTTSSRLPAKSLLPVGGYPLAVLSAKRAANTGRTVTLATSVESADDALVRAASKYNVPCFRGSLTNTLERFVEALSSYDDNTLVFRLTADNAFPDGTLLDLMESHFLEADLEYLSCGGTLSGLPYGVSAELTKLAHLREALANTTSAYDQEHVTPYVRRQYDSVFTQFGDLGKSHFRATVDTLDDYLAVEAVFSTEENSVQVGFLDLIDRLSGMPYQPIVASPCEGLVLGTAQLGMQYGVANAHGQPSQLESTHLVKTAIANGVQYLDTARAYGDSEAVLGTALRGGWAERVKVISKLSPLEECPEDASRKTVEAFVEASVYRSCTDLGCTSLDVLLMHRAAHLQRWDGVIFDTLKAMVKDNLIGTLGVSVQTPEELALALDHPEIGLIQMPFNVLEWRFDKHIDNIQARRQERSLILHARGALLQGVLASRDPAIWQTAGVEASTPITSWLEEQAVRARCDNVVSFCLKYCLSQPWIDAVVIGVETQAQLEENLRQGCVELPQSTLVEIKSTRPFLDERALNPAHWVQNRA